MMYYSTNRQSPLVDFHAATIQGQAPDKGLYFPESIPKLPASFWQGYKHLSKEEIALEVIRPFIGHVIPDEVLENIISDTVSFEFPLVKITESIYSLELYHGPTLAFKDVGARFMSRCLGHFSREKGSKTIVLVATSGDTGGAVADGFFDVDGVEVVILYPSGKVSNVQEKQLTTHGKNIHAFEVEGSFDDCQGMVKQAFADEKLRSAIFLTSANSINIARWLPQQFYYFYALQQWQSNKPPVLAVPSGNFGNLCAGLMAFAAGLPVQHFIAACNANKVVPDFFASGSFEPKPAVSTISNAMDVGNPSNFVRILEIVKHLQLDIHDLVTSYSFSDDDTGQAIREVLNGQHYLMDPHGAVGYLGLRSYQSTHNEERGIFLETAHPVKFHDVVETITGESIELPASVAKLMHLKKQAQPIGLDYQEFREKLLRI